MLLQMSENHVLVRNKRSMCVSDLTKSNEQTRPIYRIAVRSRYGERKSYDTMYI
jgi:hypothetical protein